MQQHAQQPWRSCRVHAEASSAPSCCWALASVLCACWVVIMQRASTESCTTLLQVQTLTEAGLRNLGPSVATMASLEGLDAHRRAVTLRLGLDKS